jgi:hypothetical protein
MTDQASAPGIQVRQMDMPQEEQLAMAAAALRGAAPRFYANGFVTAQTASDAAIVLLANGAVTGVLNLSMISAKTLAGELMKLIDTFEQATGSKVPTIQEIQENLNKVAAERK